MASTPMIVLISLLILPMAFHSTSAYKQAHSKAVAEKSVDVVVEGIVYCQSCKNQGTWSLSEAEPIPEAQVSVICKNHRNRISYYKAFKANEDGYFYAKLEGLKMEHYLLDHPLTSCKVKLVSSPLKSCNLLTNINYGLNGSKLRYENKRLVRKNYEAVIYAAGPLAFRPAECTPDTHY